MVSGKLRTVSTKEDEADFSNSSSKSKGKAHSDVEQIKISDDSNMYFFGVNMRNRFIFILCNKIIHDTARVFRSTT